MDIDFKALHKKDFEIAKCRACGSILAINEIIYEVCKKCRENGFKSQYELNLKGDDGKCHREM